MALAGPLWCCEWSSMNQYIIFVHVIAKKPNLVDLDIVLHTHKLLILFYWKHIYPIWMLVFREPEVSTLNCLLHVEGTSQLLFINLLSKGSLGGVLNIIGLWIISSSTHYHCLIVHTFMYSPHYVNIENL